MRRECNGAKHDTEATDHRLAGGGRGAFPMGLKRDLRGPVDLWEVRMQA